VPERIVIKRHARLDLDLHFVYIGERNFDAAERFAQAAEDAFEKLAGMPLMGTLRGFSHPRIADLRFWPILGFENYLIFYRPTPSGIEVLRVIHGAQDIDRLFEQG
jgi:toxin ParE1/3/4